MKALRLLHIGTLAVRTNTADGDGRAQLLGVNHVCLYFITGDYT